jgi:hypothetical protein
MSEGPDQSAVGVALWRAGHLYLDDWPHVLEDDIGLRLIAPSDGWLDSPGMSPIFRPWRASVLAGLGSWKIRSPRHCLRE